MTTEIWAKKSVNYILFSILVITFQAQFFAGATTESLEKDINRGRLQVFDFSRKFQNIKDAISLRAACVSCKLGVSLLRRIVTGGKSIESISKFISVFCTVFRIESPKVCQGVVERHGEDLFEAVSASTLSASEMCTFFLQFSCHDESNDWSVDVPPKVNNAKPASNWIPESAPKLKVLQISDTHWDPHYQEGTNADCDDVLCCRPDSGKPKTRSAFAGLWGNYHKCDMPTILFKNALKHIADTHKDIDYIIWTGDLPPHDIWNQNQEETLDNLKISVQLMATYFQGIPIYPSIGNHDSVPVDSFAPPEAPKRKNMSWLYDQLDDEWSQWLPSETSKTIKRGAFYSVLVRPGFRIISINSNYCDRWNFWLLKSNTDPAGQLAWLVQELQLSERNAEKVHIIGHIPPGSSNCIRVWSRNFYRIINRFESTVTAQFYGHTHLDEYEVFYDLDDIKRPINIAYIAPSLTPWEKVNPAYRIYYVDGDYSNSSRMVLDHETWKMDLDEANRLRKPIWRKAYTAKKMYNMTSLLPKEWDNLVTRMNSNPDLFDRFYRNRYRNSPVRPDCDNDCKKSLLCDLKSGRSNDKNYFCKDM